MLCPRLGVFIAIASVICACSGADANFFASGGATSGEDGGDGSTTVAGSGAATGGGGPTAEGAGGGGPSSSTGSGAGGGSGGDAGAGGASATSCPAGLPGPKLVAVDAPSGSFCIDATEVTKSQYAAFLGAAPLAGSGECAWNAAYAPAVEQGTGCNAAASNVLKNPDHPVVCVDWCDARAYCEWAGKRLCGAVGGGPSDYDTADTPSAQWFYACSRGGAQAYPYGDAYDPAACNGVDQPDGEPKPAGEMVGCEGGFEGVFDLSGNAAEWEDTCLGPDANAPCLNRSGTWLRGETPQHLACDFTWEDARIAVRPDLGFRCCVDLP